MDRVLHVDAETCCAADLRRVGADVYARDPTLIVTVLAWAFDDGPVRSVTLPDRLPLLVEDHLRSGGGFKAWNLSFETAILRNHYGLDLRPDQGRCTMQAALHSGLPAALADAGPGIGARITKDATAHRLMLQLSKPRKAGGYWHDDEAKLEALQRYCERDVESERGVAKQIAPLPPQEAAVSALDRAANERGVRIDLELVGRLKALAVTEIQALNRECAELTHGAVTSPGTQTARLQAWLTAQGVDVPDLGKEAVSGLLKGSWSPSAQRVLEIRQEVARSSLKKLDAMARCAGPDERVRGQLAYYGAFRTGRWAGRLIQPQNFPRPAIKDVASFIRHALAGLDADWVRTAWGPPLQAIASALRGCLVPAPSKAFVVYDLSQIEARVTTWLAGQQDILEAFARGEDVYMLTAAKIGSSDRQLGKVLRLACGFQMGAAKFQETAAKPPYSIVLTLEQSQTNVSGFRETNPKIVELWWAVDRAVKALLQTFKGATMTQPITAKLAAQVSPARNGRPLLTLLLPSGRRLYYRNPRLEPGLKGRPEIVYDGVDPITKRWGPVRTYGGKLTENMVQATARDVIVEAALRIDALKLGELVLSVHDELLFEVPLDEAKFRARAIGAEIDRRPDWAADLPVASEGNWTLRYGK